MKRITAGLVAGISTIVLGATTLQATPAGATSAASDQRESSSHRTDNKSSKPQRKQAKLRAKALAMLENGSATLKQRAAGGATVEVAEGTFVEFPIERDEKIFTILSEFGTEGTRKLGIEPGPLHNQIPEPDRAVDNSTTWEPDYSKAYYEELFNGSGESMREYYEAVSSGRYSVTNTVTDWVQVPGNAASYGDNSIEDLGGSWDFINDSGDAWYQSQLAAGKTKAEIEAYLSQFDVWDRYDFDGDGNFNEADGYIDHLQTVHAGEGEEAGAPEDAIWSHRWFIDGGGYGVNGPTVGGVPNLYGGAQLGDSKYFIGDYTVEPENGGLGVFAHEFGHDLGLPDYYDTGDGENSSAFWTLMSSGSWLGHGAAANDGIGTTPGLMGPEEKLYLGWLDYTEINKGGGGSYSLNPSQYTVDGADQALKVNLPDGSLTRSYTTPGSGQYAWYSGRGDGLNNTLTRTVPASGKVVVTASAWYSIEADYDFLYAEYSVDGGANWVQVGDAITGDRTRWSGLRLTYSPGGQESLFRFRYATDGGVNEPGAFLDDISIKTDSDTFTDGAEAGDNGWTVKGWKASTGTETAHGSRYYLLENRQYQGYDKGLEVGPYQFAEAVTRPNWVEFFPFQDGMLVWQVDHTYADNNVSEHPGFGNAMVVDATPNSFTYPDGTSPTNRREPFDATFGLDTIDRVCLHKQTADKKGTVTAHETCAGGVPQQATFDDSLVDAYYDAVNNPQNSVKVAGAGVKATVTGESADGTLTVQVTYP